VGASSKMWSKRRKKIIQKSHPIIAYYTIRFKVSGYRPTLKIKVFKKIYK
jgi:hypothetical protein